MIRVDHGHGVIAGLDPAIQGCPRRDRCPLDARLKAGHDVV